MELEINGDDVKVVEAKEVESTKKPAEEPDVKSVDEPIDAPKKRRLPLIVLIIGVLTLIGGGTFFALKFVMKPATRDADFLVEIGEWSRESAEDVIWNFTEIGKGTLTTNNHKNDYEFLWSINGDKLKIETKWLYDLNDEYTYKIQQDNKTLTLSSDDGDITFRAVEREETEPEPEVELES